MRKEYFGIAFRNIKRRKLRSWLTMTGIFISIAIIFMLVSLSLGLDYAVKEQFRQLGSDKFFISPRGQLAGPGTISAAKLTKADIEIIEKVSGVRDVSYWAVSNAEVIYSDQKKYTMIVGIELSKMKVFIETGFLKAEHGKLLEEGNSNKAMIGSLYSGTNFFKKSLSPRDRIKINNESFVVKGILKSVGNSQDDKLIYISLDDFRKLFPNTNGRIDQIAVQVNSGENLTAVAKLVEKKLMSFRNVDKDTKDFTIQTPEELLQTFGVILNVLTGFLLGVAAISLLVGGIGITNTMYTSVLERTKEIGVMKAIGARNFDILYLFTLESAILGFVGGVIGVILGFIAGKIIEIIAQNALGSNLLRIVTPWYLFIGCLLFAFVIGAISGVIPANQASRIRPVVALRYE